MLASPTKKEAEGAGVAFELRNRGPKKKVRGMEVAGVPEGEPGYVQARMAARLDEAESNAKLLREILCTVGHRHQALCLL